MSDSKKYYYIRLKEGFFESNELLLLQSQKDGYIYSDILLKLYLRSLRSEGRLMVNDVIPMDTNMLATVTRHSVLEVKSAIDAFRQLGLIEVLDDGSLYMSNIQSFIGKSSTEGDRKRIARNDALDKCPPELRTKVGQMSDKRPPELEIELEIEKELEIKRELEIGSGEEGFAPIPDFPPEDPPGKSGRKREKRFVKPTLDQIRDYIAEKGLHVDAEHFFDHYESNGWKVGRTAMKDWKATLRNWGRKEGKFTGGRLSANGSRDILGDMIRNGEFRDD